MSWAQVVPIANLFLSFSFSEVDVQPNVDGVVHPASLPLVKERQAAGGELKRPGHVLVHCLLPASEDLFFQANRSQANLCIPTKHSRVHPECNVVTSQVSSTNQLNGVDLDEDGELCGVADRDLVPSPPLHLVLVHN